MGQNTEGDFESGRLRSNIPSRAKAEAAFPLSRKGWWVSWEGHQSKNFDICEDQRIKNSKGHYKGCLSWKRSCVVVCQLYKALSWNWGLDMGWEGMFGGMELQEEAGQAEGGFNGETSW